jgi:hypothetical protein
MKFATVTQGYLVCLLVVAVPKLVYADGLTDLTQALTRLNVNQPISAVLQSSFVEHKGKGKSVQTKQGQVAVLVADNAQGLQVTYARDVLATITQESKQKLIDENAKTPTLSAMNRLDTIEINHMLFAAERLLHRIKQANFINETQVTYQQRQLRSINFNLPLEAMIDDKKTREYVSKFSSTMSVVIDEQGIPLMSKLSYQGKGSAYIVFSLSAQGELTSTYQVVKHRLILAHSEFNSSFSSTFNDVEAQELKTLQLPAPERVSLGD